MTALLQILADAGAGVRHLDRVRRVWLAGGRVSRDASHPGLRFSTSWQPALAQVEAALDAVSRLVSEHPADDGAVRLLSRLERGGTVETVLLPNDTVCVSSQIGCAVGCGFCMTGQGGLERQLRVEEILAQVVLARRRRRVRRVVFMGMGEPAHNLAAVQEAIRHLGRHGGIGHKELVFSTVGDLDVFRQLAAGDVRPALALSLHTTRTDLRRRLLPRAPRWAPRQLVDAAVEYARKTGHPLQLQWTLLEGVNDGEDEWRRLIEWIGGRRVVVNLIPFNPVPGTPYRRVPIERTYEISRLLHGAGIHAKLRQSRGPDVEGACGQLRRRDVARGSRPTV